MPVVTRHGAKELYLIKLGPGLFAVQQAVGERLCNGVIHQGKACAARGENLLHINAQYIRKHPAAAGQTLKRAVIAGVYAVNDAVIALQYGQKLIGQLQLRRAGLAARHVERKTLGLAGFVFLLCRGVEFVQLALIHFTNTLHANTSTMNEFMRLIALLYS